MLPPSFVPQVVLLSSGYTIYAGPTAALLTWLASLPPPPPSTAAPLKVAVETPQNFHHSASGARATAMPLAVLVARLSEQDPAGIPSRDLHPEGGGGASAGAPGESGGGLGSIAAPARPGGVVEGLGAVAGEVQAGQQNVREGGSTGTGPTSTYVYVPSRHGTPADWAVDLVNTGFKKPKVRSSEGGCAGNDSLT